jgi:hypothetical protein
MKEHCFRCGKEITGSIVFLELNMFTNRFSEEEVSEKESQGMFPFGKACARAVLKNDGDCIHIGKAREQWG